MVKLNILSNVNGFWEIVNDCLGPVNLIYADGHKEDMNNQYRIQRRLTQEYQNNKNFLQLSLEIPIPKDYMRVVTYSLGN